MNSQNKIKTAVYRILAQRESSSAKIEQKLLTKGFPAEEIGPALEALRQDGTVSDKRFAESYIRYRQNRGYGPLRIRQELQTHGLSKEMIEDQLDITDNAWFTEIRTIWRKHFKGRLPADQRERAKQLRFLYNRGFTQDQINSILKECKNI